MPRDEHDREDLLAEATALVERAELAVPGRTEHVVIGFRRDGCGSIYLTADLAWHFNTRLQLRRAYAQGLLYTCQQGRLSALRRERTADAVQLVRHDLDAAASERFLGDLDRHLTALREGLAAGHVQTIGQVPADADVRGRIQAWLNSLSSPIQLADTPRAV